MAKAKKPRTEDDIRADIDAAVEALDAAKQAHIEAGDALEALRTEYLEFRTAVAALTQA